MLVVVVVVVFAIFWCLGYQDAGCYYCYVSYLFVFVGVIAVFVIC